MLMTKSLLIITLNKQLPLHSYLNVELAVNSMLGCMASALEDGERIEIRGFGSFDLHNRPARLRRNPKTGEAVFLPTKTVVHFKPSKEIPHRVNVSSGHYGIVE